MPLDIRIALRPFKIFSKIHLIFVQRMIYLAFRNKDETKCISDRTSDIIQHNVAS